MERKLAQQRPGGASLAWIITLNNRTHSGFWTLRRAQQQRQTAERGEGFLERCLVDFEEELAFGRTAQLLFETHAKTVAIQHPLGAAPRRRTEPPQPLPARLRPPPAPQVRCLRTDYGRSEPI